MYLIATMNSTTQPRTIKRIKKKSPTLKKKIIKVYRIEGEVVSKLDYLTFHAEMNYVKYWGANWAEYVKIKDEVMDEFFDEERYGWEISNSMTIFVRKIRCMQSKWELIGELQPMTGQRQFKQTYDGIMNDIDESCDLFWSDGERLKQWIDMEISDTRKRLGCK